MKLTSRRALAALAALAAMHAAPALAQGGYGECENPFINAYGPFDYRTATPEQKNIVEINHFTAPVESLRAGKTGAIGADIDYTLRAFPNHPRALMAMVRLGQQEKTDQPRGARYTVRCYIERGMVFQPDDMNVVQVRGIWLSMQDRYPEAIRDFEKVIENQPTNANAHYNLGLAYFATKDYERARAEAKAAFDLKFPLEGLKHKLQAVGKWDR